MNKDERTLQGLYMETFNPTLGPEGNAPLQDPVLTKIDIEDVETEDEEADTSEVNMAKSELYKLAEYAPKLLDLIENYDELEGWIQAKITKASDYVSDVFHYLKYENENKPVDDGMDVEMDVEVQDDGVDNQALNDEIVNNLMNRF